jgi:uncharacterized protein (TIGR03437 family)
VTPGAYWNRGRGFLIKLNADGSKALFSTRLPGSAGSLARTADGSLYITGSTTEDHLPGESYLLKLTGNGSSAVFSTLLGETHSSFMPLVKVDTKGNIFLVSSGMSAAPTQITVSKHDADGKLIYATILGKGNLQAMDIDAEGAVYMAVGSRSWEFPRTAGAAQRSDGGTFLVKFAPDGHRLIYSTLIFYSASTVRLKAGGDGRVFVSGVAWNNQLSFGSSVDPDCYPFLDGDKESLWSGFVGELSADGERYRFANRLHYRAAAFVDSRGRYRTPGAAQIIETANPFNPDPGVRCVTHAASKRKTPIAPGQAIALHGSGIGTATVYINGILAPTLETAPDRIDAVVPFSLDTEAAATVHLLHPDRPDLPEFTVPTAEAAPGAYSVIWNENGSVNSAESPAAPGTILRFFVTGLGRVDPTPPDGAIAQEKSATKPRLLPTVRLVNGLYGNRPAELVYCGSAPGKVEGITQIEIRIPANLPTAEPYFLQLSAGSAELSNSPAVYVR